MILELISEMAMDGRTSEMEVMVAVVEQGSFSAAARRLELTPSAIAKLIGRLEQRLGTRLFLRSTRSLVLTDEGERYFAHCKRLLREIQLAEADVAGSATLEPRGPLRVSSSVGFGRSVLLELLPKFLEQYPGVELDLTLSDGIIDLYEERADVAIRSGPISDSQLKSRKIMGMNRVVVASPAYLEKHGVPLRPEDLAQHNCLRFNFRTSQDSWPFRDAEGRALPQPVSGNFLGSSGADIRQLCAAGVGIARVGRFYAEPAIAAGRLVPLLEAFNPGDIETVSAIFAGHAHLATRVRAFIDFLIANVDRAKMPD